MMEVHVRWLIFHCCLALACNYQVVMAQEAGQEAEVTGPSETLRLFGMDESTLRQFEDGRQLHPDEHEPLYRLLYLFPRFERIDLLRWRSPLASPSELATTPADVRGEIFSLSGWVEDIQTMELPAESARRFDYSEFYVLRIRLASDDERNVIVCSREIPNAWKLPAATGTVLPASCDGMFVKVGDGEDGAEKLVFVTDHMAWHPYEVNEALGVGPGKALLGRAGMDVSLFDNLDQAKPIGHNDRDCFYQMLWAVGRADPQAMRSVAHPNFNIAELLKEPAEQAGQFYQLRGLARRALRVRVDAPDVQEKYGIDHYYEVDVFLPLPRTLKLVDPRDGVARQYQTYPITICVRELPEGLQEGSTIRQEVAVDASYMKLWSFRSRFMSGDETEDAPQRRQVSPLFIASTVRTVEPAQEKIVWPETALVTGFLFSLVVIGLSAWYYSRSDRAFVDWRQRRPAELKDDLDRLASEPARSTDSD